MSSAEFAFAPPEVPSLAIVGSQARYPVRRIYCIGRNYVAHVREMGGDESRDFPIIFQKPRDSLVEDGAVIPYPTMTDNYHYELELMVAIGSTGRDLDEASALDHIFGYGICLDMTRRSLLDTPDTPRMPWELKKSFDQSAPCGPIYPVASVGHRDKGRIQLDVDGETRQRSDLSLMIWRTPEIIATLSRYYQLEPGDIIMTGTPDGVGAVRPGSTLVGTIEGLGSLTVSIAEGEVPQGRLAAAG